MLVPFLLSLLTSALIAFILTPVIIKLFISRGWVEDPRLKHLKTHNATALTAVPRGGGLPVFIAILLTSLLFLPLDKHLLGILLSAFLTLLVGLWDDLKDISPTLRLLTNFLAALVVVAAGIGIVYLSNPFGDIINLASYQFTFSLLGTHSIWFLADLLAVVWIVACMNFVGWSAGVEGQLPGFVVISAIFIGIIGLRFSQDVTEWPVIILAGAVAGAYLGFLPFNFSPQKIMPGYSGKSLAGFFLAVLAILSGAKLATVILLLGIPIIDAIFVIIKRLLRGQSPLTGGPDHLHHYLLKLHWSRPRIAVFYWVLSLLLGSISLFLNSTQKFYTFIGLLLLFVAFTLRASRRI